jgi:hypothetical protein
MIDHRSSRGSVRPTTPEAGIGGATISTGPSALFAFSVVMAVFVSLIQIPVAAVAESIPGPGEPNPAARTPARPCLSDGQRRRRLSLHRDGKAVISGELSGILERIGSTAESWWAHVATLSATPSRFSPAAVPGTAPCRANQFSWSIVST